MIIVAAAVITPSQDPISLDGIKDWLLTNAFNLLVPPEGPLSTEFLAAGVGERAGHPRHSGAKGISSSRLAPLGLWNVLTV